MATADYTPINALFGSDLEPNPEVNPQELLDSADVILGVDVMSEREFLVYGREKLEEIANCRESFQLTVVKIGLDQETEELEKLLALVQVIKGQHDYQTAN